MIIMTNLIKRFWANLRINSVYWNLAILKNLSDNYMNNEQILRFLYEEIPSFYVLHNRQNEWDIDVDLMRSHYLNRIKTDLEEENFRSLDRMLSSYSDIFRLDEYPEDEIKKQDIFTSDDRFFVWQHPERNRHREIRFRRN